MELPRPARPGSCHRDAALLEGRPRRLTPGERQEVRELLRRLEVVRFARHVGPIALKGRAAGAAAGADEADIHSDRPMPSLQDRTRFEPAEAEPRIIERWLESGSSTPSPRARPTRTSRSRSRRRTSPARCTWATRSTARSRTRSSATTACSGSARSGSSAPTTPASPRRSRSRSALADEGTQPRATRPRGVRRARLGVARAVRRHDHRAVQAPRRLAATTRTSASRSTSATSAPC